MTDINQVPYRVLFTEYDSLINDNRFFINYSSNTQTSNYWDRELTRKIKLLLITKGQIVIETSHLIKCPVANSLLLKHPELVETNAIIPLKASCSSFNDIVDRFILNNSELLHPYHLDVIKGVEDILSDNNDKAISYDTKSIYGQTKLQLINNLNDENSVLNIELRKKNVEVSDSAINELKKQSLFEREMIYSVFEWFPKDLVYTLARYIDYYNYLGYATHSSCEGTLPLVEILDYSIKDFASKKTRLSDLNIFLKLFIEIIKAKTLTVFPADFLDEISIKDVLDLREISTSISFIEKYNQIKNESYSALNTNCPIKFTEHLNKIEDYEIEFKNRFEEVINKELTSKQREKKMKLSGQILHSVASFVIPFYAPEALRSIIISSLQLANMKIFAQRLDEKIYKSTKIFEDFLQKTKLHDKQVLLDFTDEMKKKYISKMLGE